MRLTSVTLHYTVPVGFGIDVLNFSLEHEHSDSKYQIRNITGLDAEEIIPKFYAFGEVSKQKLFNMGLKTREIVMRIILNPRFEIDESYSDIRDELYRAISATRSGVIMLDFNSGPDIVSRISGFITKFEVGYFNQLPEVQITVRCDDPMFRSIAPYGPDLSTIGTNTELLITDTSSTAPHGFSFEARCIDFISAFTLADLSAPYLEWQFVVDMAPGVFEEDDVLHFSSEFTNKYLYVVRGGTTIHLMDKIQPQSVWPILFPGYNMFYFPDFLNFQFEKIEYYPAYWGI